MIVAVAVAPGLPVGAFATLDRGRSDAASEHRFLGLDRGQDDATLTLLAGSNTAAEARAELNRVDIVLKTLDPKDRIAWTLRYVEGESLEDVARLCECSLATAKRRIVAARAAMSALGVVTGTPQEE